MDTAAVATSTHSSASTIGIAPSNFLMNQLLEDSRTELTEIFESLHGSKSVIADASMRTLLNLIVPETSKAFKDNEVLHYKTLSLDYVNGEGCREKDTANHFIYFLRANLLRIKMIISHISEHIKRNTRCQFHIFFVPCRDFVCEQLLEDAQLLKYINIGEFRMGLIPIDSDIFTLQMERNFRDCYLEGDNISISTIATSLQKIQELSGIIPNIKSKGVAARKIVQKLIQLRRMDNDRPSNARSASAHIDESKDQNYYHSDTAVLHGGPGFIDTLVLLDREADFFSAMLTSLTYEGLIADIIKIDAGRVFIDAALLGEEETMKMMNVPGMNMGQSAESIPVRKPGEKVYVRLDNSDSLFTEIRDLSIESLGSQLKEKAANVKQRYTNFKEKKDSTISELHEFVKKIPQLTKDYKSLNLHINIAGYIKKTTDSLEFRRMWQTERGILEGDSFLDQIEDMICADMARKNLLNVLRLLCLSSLTGGGIKPAKYDSIRRSIVHIYGIEHLFTISNLERVGLLKRKEMILLETSNIASAAWITLRKQLRLINERVNVTRPDDISYVTAGYAPLSVRLIEMIANPGWSVLGGGEIMKLIPGQMVELSQAVDSPSTGRSQIRRKTIEPTACSSETLSPYYVEDELNRKKNMLVFYVGGVTYLEIAALRYLSRDPCYPYNIFIASTSVLDGESFLKSMLY